MLDKCIKMFTVVLSRVTIFVIVYLYYDKIKKCIKLNTSLFSNLDLTKLLILCVEFTVIMFWN